MKMALLLTALLGLLEARKKMMNFKRKMGVVWIPRASSTQNKALRILSGVDDTRNNYPYVVCIVTSHAIRTCTGSLITPLWVLTAAHCDLGTHIRFGNMTVKSKHSRSYRKIVKKVLHPGYRDLENNLDLHIENDIALFLIDRTVELGSYGRLSAVEYSTLWGGSVSYAGFGSTYEEDVNVTAEILDAVRMLQVGEGVALKCDEYFNGMRSAMNICTAPRCTNKEQMVLGGDSGGPLLHRGRIAGVLSSGFIYIPVSVFMPVSPHLAWIQRVIGVR